MSAIPPANIASILQSPGAQQHASRTDDAERNEQARRTRQLAGDADAILEVEATEDDTEVHADAEGFGGSGRSTRDESSGQDEAGAAASADPPPPPMPHLDVMA